MCNLFINNSLKKVKNVKSFPFATSQRKDKYLFLQIKQKKSYEQKEIILPNFMAK